MKHARILTAAVAESTDMARFHVEVDTDDGGKRVFARIRTDKENRMKVRVRTQRVTVRIKRIGSSWIMRTERARARRRCVNTRRVSASRRHRIVSRR